MPEVIKKIRGRRYRYHYKWEKAGGKWKKVWTYLGSAEATYSTHRFFAGGFGFVLKALMGQLPTYPEKPVQVDAWAKYRNRMSDEQWAVYRDRLKSAHKVYPPYLAEHVARKDLPNFTQSYAVSYATDFRYENWYSQRVAEVQAWRADQETRKEEIAEKRAQLLSSVQPPEGYIDIQFLYSDGYLHPPLFSEITPDGRPAPDKAQPEVPDEAPEEPEAAPDAALDTAPDAPADIV